MKLEDLIDDQSAQRLGFAWLRSAVAPVSPYGARAFERLRPYRPGEEGVASQRADEIHRRSLSVSADRVAAILSDIAALPDVAGIVARASIGEVLNDSDFYELMQFCARADEMESVGNAATSGVRSALLRGRCDTSAFYLADAFDDALGAARRTMSETQAEFEAVRGRERAAVASALGRDEIAGDEFIVMRDDVRGPLPSGVRVLREAATYFSCTLEYGAHSLEASERRDAAIAAVGVEEARARARLSGIVRENAAGLNAAAQSFASLDLTLSAVRYAQRHACAPATLVETPSMDVACARFLPLEEQLGRVGRQFVPIDFALDGPAAITGPNMGGKTVAMQTCGFVALAAAFGLPVPAQHASVALFDRIAWLGVGREEGNDGLLSSFAVEIIALKSLLEWRPQRAAVFIDEFARTTSPAEGIALTVALLERLRVENAYGLAATHLPGVATAAAVPHFAVRNYRISQADGDEEASGDAIMLAQSLGMDDDFVAAAFRALKGTAWIR